MRVPGVARSRPWPGGRHDGGDLQVSPLFEGVEPGRIAVSKCLSHCLEQLQPRVLLASEQGVGKVGGWGCLSWFDGVVCRWDGGAGPAGTMSGV